MIGPNGAGKSSMLNVISGFYRPQKGEVWFRGERRGRMRPHRVARQGIARTFQNIALFRGMSTLDNLMTGRLTHMHRGFLWQALWAGPAEAEEIANREVVEKIIDFLEIQSDPQDAGGAAALRLAEAGGARPGAGGGAEAPACSTSRWRG